MIKKYLFAILSVLNLIADLLTIIIFLNPNFTIGSFKPSEIDGFNKILFWFALSLIMFGIPTFFFIRYLYKKGVAGVPLNYKLALKRLNPYLLSHYSNLIHDFQHIVTESIKEVITNNETDIGTRRARKRTVKLLDAIRHFLKTIIGVDFSVHLKLFESAQNEHTGDVKINDALLYTYERVPSLIEKKKMKHENLSARNSSEKFFIERWQSNTKIEDLYESITSNLRPNGNKRNLSYDYALGPSKHFYLSNSLKRDSKKKKFCSSSENYELYYKSLGVFIISSNTNCGQHLDGEKILGVLIIDANETKVMHKTFIRDIMGYFSHRIFEYLIAYDVAKN